MHLRTVSDCIHVLAARTLQLLVVIKLICPINESASFQLPVCIMKIPNGFHVVIGASCGGYLSRQINVAFPLSQSTLLVRCIACGKGFRDGVKVKTTMEMNTFTTHRINMSSGHCTDNDVNDNLINVKELGMQALSDSISDDKNRRPTEYLNTRMQVERSLTISRLVLGYVMKLQPSCE